MLRYCARDNRHAGVIVSPTMSSFRRTALIIKTVISSMTGGSASSDPVRQAVRDALSGCMAARLALPMTPRHGTACLGKSRARSARALHVPPERLPWRARSAGIGHPDSV